MSSPSDPEATPVPQPGSPPRRPRRRRLLRWTVRIAATLFTGILVLGAAGFAWDQIASRGFESAYPAPGRQVQLPDGRDLHFVVRGDGTPTLVLVSGAGGPYTDWLPVLDDLAETTRVVAYDRAGYGWSDPSSSSGAAAVTADLHHGLAALGVDGPIVLVGHSIGGPYIRHYAATHPDRIVGLVFVDSSHEDQMNRMPAPMVEMMDRMTTVFQVAAFASRFGVLRALDVFGAHPFTYEGMPAARRAMALRSSTTRAYAREMGSIETTIQQTLAAAVPFEDLPILVLSATTLDLSQVPPSMHEYADEMQANWNEMQAELAALSTDSRLVPVPAASHYVQFDRPDVVVSEIRAMLEAMRQKRPLASIPARTEPADTGPSETADP
jgi:pimeloyl-ACP methyl ester carboxylesterase